MQTASSLQGLDTPRWGHSTWTETQVTKEEPPLVPLQLLSKHPRSFIPWRLELGGEHLHEQMSEWMDDRQRKRSRQRQSQKRSEEPRRPRKGGEASCRRGSGAAQARVGSSGRGCWALPGGRGGQRQ